MALEDVEYDPIVIGLGYAPLTIAFLLVFATIFPLFTSFPDLNIPPVIIAFFTLIGYGVLRYRGDRF